MNRWWNVILPSGTDFSTRLTGTSNTFVGNAAIFGKVYFPRLVIPLSVIISNIIKFGIQFRPLLAVLLYYGFTKGHFYFGISWLLILIPVIMMAGLGLGFSIFKRTDWFWGTAVNVCEPIVYSASYIRGISKHGYLIDYNPLTAVVEGFRYAVFGGTDFHLASRGYSFAWMGAVLLLGVIFFNKTEKSFRDTV